MKNIIILLALFSYESMSQTLISPKGQTFPTITVLPASPTKSQLVYSTKEDQIDGSGFYGYDGSIWQKIKPAGSGNLPQSAEILSQTLSNPNLENIGVVKVGAIKLGFEGWQTNLSSSAGFNSINSKPVTTHNNAEVIFWGGKYQQFCGINCSQPAYSNVGRYFKETDNSWNLLPAIPTFSGREFHSNVYYEATNASKLIVWGGFDGTNYRNDGAIFDNSNNQLNGTWAVMNPNSAPSARSEHSAVIYKDGISYSMIVWGGKNQTQAFGDGKLYSPLVNGWSAASIPISGLANRYGHEGFLTGNGSTTPYRMVIFGGKTFSGTQLYDGKIYNPSTNSWTSMASFPTTATLTIEDNTSIATRPDYICVYGGLNNAGANNTNLGAIYHVSPTGIGNWTLMNATNSPRLYEHSSIIIQRDNVDRVYFFGGRNWETSQKNKKVYVYNISNDTWEDPIDIQPALTPNESGGSQLFTPSLVSVGQNILAWQPNGSNLLGGVGGIFQPYSLTTFYTFKKR